MADQASQIAISDKVLAKWSLQSYLTASSIFTDDVHVLIGVENGIQIIAFEGTDPKRIMDLIRDAEALGLRNDPILGPVSESFIGDAEEIVWRLKPLITPPFAVTGHSKGAADGQAVAVLLDYMGLTPIKLTVFAPPQLGCLGGRAAKLPGRAYRHGEDPITCVPEHRGNAQLLVDIPWVGEKPFDPLVYHSMQRYYDACPENMA